MFSSSVMSSFLLPCEGQPWQYWSLTITLLGLTWCATLLSVFLCMRLRRQKNLINQQQCEIDRFQTVEQTAIISQARKLMHRLASDIHDGPLQELKLIMDRLELLQMESPQLPIDPILDQLETLGTHLRQHLSQTRAIALTITPELRDGLAQGIQLRLTQLTQSGELTLHVTQDLHPLEEPTLNSLWLEAREDIYRFFNEAIHNVILHAQPPHGTATQITVTLEQQNTLCTLTLENDGALLDLEVFEPTRQQRQRGGYGTKLLDTIAAELPKGSIERTPLPTGGLRLQLTWEQIFGLNGSVHT
jgi:signal transduction histidine kinase